MRDDAPLSGPKIALTLNAMQVIYKSLILILSSLLVLGCSSSADKPANDNEQAISLMEQGEYSSAIYVLEGHLSQDPNDSKSYLLLAASYAGRAGILMTHFIDVAKAIEEAKQAEQYFDSRGLVSLSSNSDSKAAKATNDILLLLNKFYKAIFRVNQFISIFELIPTPQDKTQLLDLKTAISVLNSSPSLTDGAIFYRGLLKISQLKYSIKNNYKFSLNKGCSLDLREFQTQILSLQEDLQSILLDFSNGTINSDKRNKILASFENFNSAFTDIFRLTSRLNRSNSSTISLRSAADSLGAQCK